MVLDHRAADVEHLERLNQLIRTGRIGSAGKDRPDKSIDEIEDFLVSAPKPVKSRAR